MCEMCLKSRKEDGRITVEMAFLLPVIILWIVWLVNFMLFLMDMSVLKSEVIRLSDEASMIKGEEGELDTGRYDLRQLKNRSGLLLTVKSGGISADKVSVRLKKRLEERLMLTECRDIKVNVGTTKVSIQGTLRFLWSFPGFRTAGEGGQQFTGRAVSPVNNWEQWLWIVSAATDIQSSE